MNLDYSPFEKALSQLEKSLSFYRSEMARNSEDLREQFRAAVIQTFEYTYELGIKMLRRQLTQIVANPGELKEMSFMDLIRTGKEAGLVREAPAYREFREKRNITSHTYDADAADEIITVIDSFVGEMRYLLIALEKRNKSTDDVD